MPAHIINVLRTKGYQVYKEVFGLPIQESTRRIAIIAFEKKWKTGYTVGQTIIRLETHGSQPEKVNNERNPNNTVRIIIKIINLHLQLEKRSASIPLQIEF